jgi:parallel beta-helix repeat protein
VIAGAGTYSGFNLFTSGTAASRITFQADPAAGVGGVVINRPNPWNNLDGINLEGASYVTVEGFTVTGQPRAGIRSVANQFDIIRNNVADANTVWGIFTGFSSDLLVENNQASRSAQQHGIYVSNSADRPVVRGNRVFENNASGIQLNADASQGGDGVISNAVIENNVLRANGAAGGASINLDGVQDSDIRNNLIQDARATGIALFRQDGATGSTNNRIVNNTVVVDNSLNQANGRWAVSLTGVSTGNLLKNNILFSSQSFRGALSVSADSRAGLVSDYNAVENRFSTDDGNTAIGLAGWQTATGQDVHSFSLNDITALNGLFVDRATGNYHLASTSAAIDRGTSVGAPPTDYEGNARPSGAGYDIGADEFVVAVLPPANTAPTISAISNLTLTYNSAASTIAFTVGDAQTPAGSLVVSVTSSNPTLFPSSGLALGGSGANRTLSVKPALFRTGTAVITVKVTDAGGLTTTTSFTITVLKRR